MFSQCVTKIRNKFKFWFNLNYVLFFRLIFGLYYDLSTSLVIRFIARVYCIFFLLFCLNDLFNLPPATYFDLMSLFWYHKNLAIDASVNIIISFITAEKEVLEFVSKFSEAIRLNGFIYVNLLISHLILNIFECMFYPTPNLISLTFVTRVTAYNGRISSFYISDMIRRTVKCLRLSFSNKLKNKMLTDEEKIVHIDTFLKAFMKLIKSIDRNINYIRFKMVFYLICDYLRILTILYFTLSTKYVALVMIAWYSQIFFHLLLTCAPCISMEIAINDLEEIKCILAEQLLMYEDPNLRTVVLQTLDYIDACTSKFTLWNKFPMNIKLLLRVFDLCASYVIALLQFVY